MSETDFNLTAPKKRGRPRKCDAFDAHVEKIESAKKYAAEIIGENFGGEKTPQAVLNMAWEIVFDFFLRAKSGDVDISELNTLAGIVQKLVSSSGALGNIDLKTQKNCKSAGLSEDAVREIERKLKLL